MNTKKQLFAVTAALLAAALLFSAGCVAQNSGSLEITNSDGSITVLSGVPERIVLLNSNAGEILYLLGSEDKIIGISQSIKNNDEQAAMYSHANVVGTWNEPDVETLISLKADLVLGYASSKPKNADMLSAAGIPIVYVDCTKPETMVSDIKEIGKLSGNQDRANQIAAYYDAVMMQVADAAKTADGVPQTIYAESYSPYYAQGTDSGLGQLITLTGGQNILDKPGSPKVSAEWVVATNPQIVIKVVNSMNTAESTFSELQSRIGFSEISAVKNNKVWIIRNDITYGPRSCAAAVAVLKMQHPELLPGITSESVLEEFNEMFGTSFDTKNLSYPEIV
ncbi:MAG: ABC transporter substrate-binding protein [Methanocorpusculum sp.]|nr:ABC transporter substrate-binding protein [Methanocorpusculum sp.]